MFTKDEIKARMKTLREQAMVNGELPIESELNLALVILSTSLFHKKLRSGEDYSAHPLTVATSYTRSKNKKIIGILHDVVEDSDWTIDDLREIGFSERILKGVDGVTKRPGEPYFDFIVRCSLSGDDAIDVKINDLHHNSDATRYRHIDDSAKTLLKNEGYNIAYHYLIDLKKYREDHVTHYNYPGTPMLEYIMSREEFSRHPFRINELMEAFSSEPGRLPLKLSLPWDRNGPAPV
jgi:hypothetical protein